MIKEYFFILMMIFLTVSGQFCIKKGASELRFDCGLQTAMRSCLNSFLWTGFLLIIIGPVFYILALKKIELSKAFAFSSANYILVVLGSRLIFKEQVNLWRWGGVILISLGIILFGISS